MGKEIDTNEPTEVKPKHAHEAFYDRIKEIKAYLPQDYKLKLLKLLPKAYDSYSGGLLITGVLNCRTTDVVILEALEKIVKPFLPKKDKAG